MVYGPTARKQEEATMNDNVTSTQKLAYTTRDGAPVVKGRREFFTYRELGVTEATNGVMRAQVMHATRGMSKPTGWHYHTCDQQFIYMLKGWVDLEFEDGRKIRLGEGDSMMIPGGLKHNETATSEEMEILEVSVPAALGTVPCDPPNA
jgi:quercetin dioxygenase-like cupin family protein